MLRQSLRLGSQGAVLGFGGVAGVQAYQTGSNPSEAVVTVFSTLGAGLGAALAALKQAAPQQQQAAPNAELVALVASQQGLSLTLERLLRAQGAGTSPLALASVVGVAGLGFWCWWGGFGWVSLQQLTEGLTRVQATLSTAIAGVKAEMLRRFALVQAGVDQANQGIKQVKGRNWASGRRLC